MIKLLPLGAVILLLTYPTSAQAGTDLSRVCIQREAQNGSLNISPTILTVLSQKTHRIAARMHFEDAGTLCVRLPRGRYELRVRLARPWTRRLPYVWWTRTYPIYLRTGDAQYLMTNPQHNDEFQAMIAGLNGWHRLWPVHRIQ